MLRWIYLVWSGNGAEIVGHSLIMNASFQNSRYIMERNEDFFFSTLTV